METYLIGMYHYNPDPNHCCINQMTSMFEDSNFTGDISNWDLSNTYVLNRMFKNSDFTGDISNWDVSNVLYMEELFMQTDGISDISGWDVSSVKYMNGMFMNNTFNGDISSWIHLSKYLYKTLCIHHLTVIFLLGIHQMLIIWPSISTSKFNGDISSGYIKCYRYVRFICLFSIQPRYIGLGYIECS